MASETDIQRLTSPKIFLIGMTSFLVIVGFVALALYQPISIALLLDASASMSALDGGTTRFEQARAAVRQRMAALADSDTTTLIRVGAPVLNEHDRSEVESNQIDFVQAFYGQLLATLPR